MPGDSGDPNGNFERSSSNKHEYDHIADELGDGYEYIPPASDFTSERDSKEYEQIFDDEDDDGDEPDKSKDKSQRPSSVRLCKSIVSYLR